MTHLEFMAINSCVVAVNYFLVCFVSKLFKSNIYTFDVYYLFLLVELENKDGRTHFVPRAKKPKQKNVETDVDLTVLALESPPYGFLSLSNGPYVSLVVLHQPYVLFLDCHDHNAPLTSSHEPHASFSVSRELKPPLSVSHDPSALFSDSHESNKLLSNPHELEASYTVSHDAISYPGIINEDAP
uniref:Uncharacterized protein n=1 Tax=Lactuca sativa TaxID=4236 RepID=A0A9R1VL73_LACSA|nr:hypothetical protein LSAT_V11C500254160 [Lactuca sativa]